MEGKLLDDAGANPRADEETVRRTTKQSEMLILSGADGAVNSSAMNDGKCVTAGAPASKEWRPPWLSVA